MNILILSAGTRVKIIEYFKEHLAGQGRVIATDLSPLAPALYAADSFYTVPEINDPSYMDVVLEICKKEDVMAVLSLIDPELLLLSKNRSKFESNNIKVIVSDYDLVSLANDKYTFHQSLKEQGLNYIPSYINYKDFLKAYDSGEVSFPCIAKPYNGSASIGIQVLDKLDDVEKCFNDNPNIMVQKYMKDKEFGADVYIDLIDGEIKSTFLKEKIRMRAGETDKSVSVYIPEVESMIKKFIEIYPYRGIIDIDIFEFEGNYYISEVNPRFGGGYLHGEEANFSVIPLLLKNIGGETNQNYVINKNENSVMMKYSAVIMENMGSDKV